MFEKIREYLLSDSGDIKSFKAIRFFFIGGILILVAWLVYFAGLTAIIPYPIEYREGAAQVMTQILLRGGNPFSLEYQPLAMNNYGVAYGLVVYPFAAIFGNTLTVHRAITLLFMILIALLTFKTISKYNSDLYFSLACSIFVLIPMASQGAIGAFPSALGTFLFLAGVLIPFQRFFDTRGLLVSALACIGAFYAKPYFLLSFGIVASYVFLFFSKKKGLLYSIFFLLMFAGSLLLVRYAFDLYFIDTVIGNLANTKGSPQHLVAQLVEFVREFYPALGLALTIVLIGAARVDNKTAKPGLDFRAIGQPFVTQPANYFLYFLVCSTLAFLLILGLHIGNYMIYGYQIIVPPLLLWLFQQLGARSRLALFAMPVLLFNMTVLSGTFLGPDRLSQKDSPEWARLYEYVEDDILILNSSLIVPAMVERGLLPVDSGQTKYFYSLTPYPSNRLLGPEYSIVKQDGRLYKEAIIDSVKRMDYDRIMLDDVQWIYAFVYDDLILNYSLVEQITVDMPQTGQQWTVMIWEPIDGR
jgi:hypothetical protein